MAGPIRFRLNGSIVEIDDLAPTETLLNWLRYHRGMTGTKEGCAEGDCGACTVALREVRPDGVVTRPVCACIQLLGMVHGRDIITVEGLAAPDGQLHPVQRAMVDNHGSQCGFCTPGIVMSLWCAGRTAEDDDLAEVLGGNLCRCTGYGPILAAGQAAAGQVAGWEEADEDLPDLGGPLDYAAAGRRFIAPVDIDGLGEAVAAHPDATLVAGATDVGLWVTKHGFDPEVMIHTGRVAELQQMTEQGGVLSIGAGVTYADALDRLAALSTSLGALIKRIGARQVRAMGTIGGNIANGSPIGDMAPALIALGARLVVSGKARREIDLQDFFIEYGRQDLRPGEFVEAVRVPIPDDPDRLSCHKISKRHDQDITAVLGCFDIVRRGGQVTSARLAFGGMAGTPKRALAAESALIAQPWSEATISAAADALAQDFQPMTDQRGSAAYRMQTARALLWREYHYTQGTPASVWEMA